MKTCRLHPSRVSCFFEVNRQNSPVGSGVDYMGIHAPTLRRMNHHHHHHHHPNRNGCESCTLMLRSTREGIGCPYVRHPMIHLHPQMIHSEASNRESVCERGRTHTHMFSIIFCSGTAVCVPGKENYSKPSFSRIN